MNSWNLKKSLVLGIVLLGTACGPRKDKNTGIYDAGYVTQARLEAQRLALIAPELRQGMERYESCEALAADLNASIQQRWVQQKAGISDSIASMFTQRHDQAYPTMDSASSGTSAPEATPTVSNDSANTGTNVQEVGVDEADHYRIGRDQIYALSFRQMQVIDRTSLQLLGVVDVSSWYSAQFFTKDDRLVVVGPSIVTTAPDQYPQGKPTVGATTTSAPAYPGYGYAGDVKIAVYQTAAGQLPKLLTESTVKGSYLDSRLVQNQLVLVLGDQAAVDQVPVTFEDFADEAWFNDPKARSFFDNSWKGAMRDSGIRLSEQSLNGIPCQNYVKRKMADLDTGLSKVMTLDITASQNPAQNIGVIGQGGEMYMTPDSLYLLKTQVQWFEARWGGWNWAGSADEKLLIQQIGFDGATGALKPLADGEVRGRIKDRWALHGIKGGQGLAIATTTGFTWSRDQNVAQNHLFILESDPATQRLNVIGSVEDFGTNEDIRSVRYVENIAYVVTFRQTDPLFAIDITDPKAPKMLSGLKVPGFSTYMHPLASGRLLGVGFDAFETGQVRGVQVSLFDTSDPTQMSRLDVEAYGSSGSNSDVTRDHHAFFYDSTSQLIGIPLVELYNYGSLKFSGAQLLAFDGNTLVDKGRITHREWIPSYCQSQMAYGGTSLDINRLYRVDNRLITLSAYGLKAYSLTDFAVPTSSVQFKVPVGECQSSYPIPL